MMHTTSPLTLVAAAETCLAVNELFYSNAPELVRNLRAPNNLREALCQGSPDERNKWKNARCEEFENLDSNGAWTPCTLPKGGKMLGTKTVFKIKSKSDGTLDRHKAGEVAQGFRQIEGLDCTETFLAKCLIVTVRTLIALATHHGWRMLHFDVTGAYLYGKLEEGLCARVPEGCLECCRTHNKQMHSHLIRLERGGNQVCLKLQKSIYGLKQAGRVWNKTFETFLKTENLVKSAVNPCLYVNQEGGCEDHFAIALCVDDLLVVCGNTSKAKAKLENFKQNAAKHFKIQDLGDLQWFLGIKVDRLPNLILWQ